MNSPNAHHWLPVPPEELEEGREYLLDDGHDRFLAVFLGGSEIDRPGHALMRITQTRYGVIWDVTLWVRHDFIIREAVEEDRVR